nr:MAG TPA: hypothetical protein [Caudoviricetes sp.]
MNCYGKEFKPEVNALGFFVSGIPLPGTISA